MTEVYTVGDLPASIRRIVSILRPIQSCALGAFITNVGGRPTAHTRLQTLFNVKFINELDRTLYELLMTYATRAEGLGPGGFNRSVTLLLEKFDGHGNSDHLEENRQSRAVSVHASIRDMNEIMCSYASFGGTRSVAMVKEAVALAGFGGRIIVEKTTSATPSVELVRGYTFELQQLLPMDVSFVRPRIVCIDGFIESVSEVHHLLEASGEAKEPVVMFVRGMSEDVKHTLKVNYDRGSLRVVPVGVPFDLEGMNSLVDLSVVTGCDLTSSLKGDVISNVKFEGLSRVDQVTIFRGRVVVTNTCTHERVKEHVFNLRKRREVEDVEDVTHLLDKRIKSLSPNHVVIRLPDDKDFVVNSQAIDYALRALRSAVEHGVTEDGRLATTELVARTYADRCYEVLMSVGAYLT